MPDNTNTNSDHATTPEELLEAALIQQIESIKAYQAKYEKEQANVQAETSD